MKVEAFDHIHIYSKNPEEASKFYLQYFDAEKLYQKKGDSGRRIFISLGGQIIVIGPFPTDRSEVNTDNLKIKRYQHQFGIDHFGIRVKNLKAAVEELREKGVKILTEPVNGASGISYAFVAGPDGVIIELTEYGVLPKLFLKHKGVITKKTKRGF